MKYEITKAYPTGSGFLQDKSGASVAVSLLAPKVGDIVEGMIGDQYLPGGVQQGLSVSIGTPGGDQSKIFIPAANLKAVADSTPATSSPVNSAIGSSSSSMAANASSALAGIEDYLVPQFSGYTVVGTLVGAGVGFGVYWLMNHKPKQVAGAAPVPAVPGRITKIVVYCVAGAVLGMFSGQATSGVVKKLSA